MIEIGRTVIKTAGRDAGKKAVIIDILEDNYVLIDGETRRRKCNILHIEPLKETIKIAEKASHEEVAKALKEIGIEARTTKPRQKTERPKKTVKEIKQETKEVKKEKPKKEAKKTEKEKLESATSSAKEKKKKPVKKKNDILPK